MAKEHPIPTVLYLEVAQTLPACGWSTISLPRLYLLPPGASPTQHACPGKAFTHEAQFAKFIVEPWAAMTGKEDSEGQRGEQRERE